jgi:mRNA-degrading endonuclease RelE of RelBE toxin-antitoxin system
MKRIFIETSAFSSSIKEFSQTDPDLLLRIQSAILADPEIGDLIPGAGGARKMRVAGKGRGKSGSYRIIYYDLGSKGEVFLIALYGKNKKLNITAEETRLISKLIKQINKI